VQECAVVGLRTGGFETTAICCAYAAETDQLSPASLRRDLKRMLPDYMLPSRWKAFGELPKNVNGKIDRRALKELFEAEARDGLRFTAKERSESFGLAALPSETGR
jgi:acyl-coenzyme A synthetase/AMP-(fatty) acid ligase